MYAAATLRCACQKTTEAHFFTKTLPGSVMVLARTKARDLCYIGRFVWAKLRAFTQEQPSRGRQPAYP